MEKTHDALLPHYSRDSSTHGQLENLSQNKFMQDYTLTWAKGVFLNVIMRMYIDYSRAPSPVKTLIRGRGQEDVWPVDTQVTS